MDEEFDLSHLHPSRRDLPTTYDKYAQERDHKPRESWKIEERLPFLTLLQQEGQTSLLEIGAGPGYDAKFFRDNGMQVVCVDLSRAMVELYRHKGLEAYVMDMARLHFPDESFQAIYAMNSLLHLPKAELPRSLQEINWLQVDDGLFCLGMYGGVDSEGIREEDSYTPKRFFSLFTDDGLLEQVKPFFEVLDFKTILFDSGGSLHLQSLILRNKVPKSPGWRERPSAFVRRRFSKQHKLDPQAISGEDLKSSLGMCAPQAH